LKIARVFAIRALRIPLVLLLAIGLFIARANFTPANAQTRTIDAWLEFKFDARAPMGDARNPAVILPTTFADVIGLFPGAKRNGDVIFVSAVDFQRVANQPLASIALAPILGQLSNLKSFDGFNAVDLAGLVKNLPSEIVEAVDAPARRQNPDEIKRLLRDGDIVFGAHVINYMTWGRFNHVAVVLDAERGVLAESTADLPTDMPGVRLVDWTKFAVGYSHIGVVRLKGGAANELPRVIRWINDRKGRPYRWPIIQGLDKLDQSRFYCSQLVWLAFKDVLNLDLDADKGVIVFPDDIYYSKEYVDVIVP
jgi:hypothetical protein